MSRHNNKDCLYIIDISNMMYRAYYVHEDLVTNDGFPTGAIHGTFSMLYALCKEHNPKHMLICYDWAGNESIRKSIYPHYKENRGVKSGISAQETIIRYIVNELGIAHVEYMGYEADDLIAAAVKKYKSAYDIVIVSGDKDLLQLIDHNISILDTKNRQFYSFDEVDKKFGVKPNQVSDFLAIAGDKCDEIPGIKGIGAVGARKLLNQYSTLEEIYKHAKDIPGALGNKIRADKENAFMSQALTHLYDDVPLDDVNVNFNPTKNEALLRLFNNLQFTSNIKKLHLLWDQYK